jgi:hypothetical protein
MTNVIAANEIDDMYFIIIHFKKNNIRGNFPLYLRSFDHSLQNTLESENTMSYYTLVMNQVIEDFHHRFFHKKDSVVIMVCDNMYM